MSLLNLLMAPFRRAPRRPLSQRRPEMPVDAEVPLGMEGLDLASVEQVNRRNDALERTHWTFSQNSSRSAATHIKPMPEDETYAATYHRAFQKQKD
ncbi:hypothetical protein [Pseudaestuariivita sp.]|uniref:hypothetical protein n=1 Tax=Pseudaestuariivita sp. TaxID=2211669 RepID=UPI004058EA88